MDADRVLEPPNGEGKEVVLVREVLLRIRQRRLRQFCSEYRSRDATYNMMATEPLSKRTASARPALDAMV